MLVSWIARGGLRPKTFPVWGLPHTKVRKWAMIAIAFPYQTCAVTQRVKTKTTNCFLGTNSLLFTYIFCHLRTYKYKRVERMICELYKTNCLNFREMHQILADDEKTGNGNDTIIF